VIVVNTVSEVRQHLNRARAAGHTVGMVGTTGSLHEGHLSLVRRAKADNDVAAMFWSGTLRFDWAAASAPSYSPDMERDMALSEANGLDVFFVLDGEDLYAEPPGTSISLPSFAEAAGRLEDPVHLRTVATMVTTFCNIAGPCRTYFGEKDWQQLAMLQKMARDLYLPYEIVACPTIRERDGVAISSRNQKLTPEHRAAAPVIYQGLLASAEAVASGERDPDAVADVFAAVVGSTASINYVKIVDPVTLAPLKEIADDARILVSASFGDVRLVDNIRVRAGPEGSIRKPDPADGGS
jgi:pantoate--beta-alanine ligase